MVDVYFNQRIFVSVTGEGDGWRQKIEDINKLKIASAAVFIERFEKEQRKELYDALLYSCIKEVPLVHMRHDAAADEMEFFIKNFGTKLFNIHEDTFNFIDQWRGYWDKLYLEMNYDSNIAANVDISKIGGFCVDLAHLKAAIARGADEAFYIISHLKKTNVSSNHLSGYSFDKNEDVHFASDLKDFDYLAVLPKAAFGQIIAMEVDNDIADQLKFKDRAAKILNNYFK
jgi:hypothetical protein